MHLEEGQRHGTNPKPTSTPKPAQPPEPPFSSGRAEKVPSGYYQNHRPSGFRFDQPNGGRASVVSPTNRVSPDFINKGNTGFDNTITDIY